MEKTCSDEEQKVDMEILDLVAKLGMLPKHKDEIIEEHMDM